MRANQNARVKRDFKMDLIYMNIWKKIKKILKKAYLEKFKAKVKILSS